MVQAWLSRSKSWRWWKSGRTEWQHRAGSTHRSTRAYPGTRRRFKLPTSCASAGPRSSVASSWSGPGRWPGWATRTRPSARPPSRRQLSGQTVSAASSPPPSRRPASSTRTPTASTSSMSGPVTGARLRRPRAMTGAGTRASGRHTRTARSPRCASVTATSVGTAVARWTGQIAREAEEVATTTCSRTQKGTSRWRTSWWLVAAVTPGSATAPLRRRACDFFQHLMGTRGHLMPH